MQQRKTIYNTSHGKVAMMLKKKRIMQTITVTVTSRDGEKFVKNFSNLNRAAKFCLEETMWESCLRVECEALNCNEYGFFVTDAEKQ